MVVPFVLGKNMLVADLGNVKEMRKIREIIVNMSEGSADTEDVLSNARHAVGITASLEFFEQMRTMNIIGSNIMLACRVAASMTTSGTAIDKMIELIRDNNSTLIEKINENVAAPTKRARLREAQADNPT